MTSVTSRENLNAFKMNPKDRDPLDVKIALKCSKWCKAYVNYSERTIFLCPACPTHEWLLTLVISHELMHDILFYEFGPAVSDLYDRIWIHIDGWLSMQLEERGEYPEIFQKWRRP